MRASQITWKNLANVTCGKASAHFFTRSNSFDLIVEFIETIGHFWVFVDFRILVCTYIGQQFGPSLEPKKIAMTVRDLDSNFHWCVNLSCRIPQRRKAYVNIYKN